MLLPVSSGSYRSCSSACSHALASSCGASKRSCSTVLWTMCWCGAHVNGTCQQ